MLTFCVGGFLCVENWCMYCLLLRCATIVGKSGFSTYLLYFIGLAFFSRQLADSVRILLIIR